VVFIKPKRSTSVLSHGPGYRLRVQSLEKLSLYAKHGHLEIDNDLIENAIRPVALGRKNYLPAGSHKAAQRAAMIYSFFAMCKYHEVNPHEWLKQRLTKIPDTKMSELHWLMPGHGKAITM